MGGQVVSGLLACSACAAAAVVWCLTDSGSITVNPPAVRTVPACTRARESLVSFLPKHAYSLLRQKRLETTRRFTGRNQDPCRMNPALTGLPCAVRWDKTQGSRDAGRFRSTNKVRSYQVDAWPDFSRGLRTKGPNCRRRCFTLASL